MVRRSLWKPKGVSVRLYAPLRATPARNRSMRQQVCRHECPVAVATHADAVWIGYNHLHALIDGRFGAGDNLLDVRVVHVSGSPTTGMVRIHHGVTLRNQKQ